mgnify:FL=1
MMEEFDDAQNVGELLRNTRLKKGKTLGDVSKDLCIRKVYLEAIENLDTKNLPQMPYGLGFVRSYSEYLGLNSARIVQAYRQAAYADEGKEIINEENAASTPEYNGPGLLHICIGLIGIAAVFAIWSGVSSYSQSKQVPEEKEVLESDVVPEPVIIEENDASLSEMGIDDAVNNEESSENLQNSEQEASVEGAEKKVEKTEPEPIAEEKTEDSDATTVPHMQIVLSGPSWLELKQGNKVLLSGIYSKGFKYDVPNEMGFIVSVGRYYNVDFYVDGKLTKIASAMKQTNISLDKYISAEQKQD